MEAEHIYRIKNLNAVMKHRNKGKLYLFGAGKWGKEVLDYLGVYHIEVAAFIDNNEEIVRKYDHDVMHIKQFIANADQNDFILITCGAFKEIENQLKGLGWKNYMFYREVPDIKEYVIDYDEVQASIVGRTCCERAVGWLLNHKIENGGICYSDKESRAYPEVTGYLIPTLIDYGHYDVAKDCMKWLLSIQEADGGYCDIDRTKEFIFDTSQILKGMLRFVNDQEIGSQVRRSVEKACAFLYANMIDEGKGGYIKQYEHDKMIPESILIYTLPPLKEAAKLTEDHKIIQAVENCVEYYEAQENFLNIHDLTHFLAYEIEALIDLERQETAVPILDKLWDMQKEDGAIPAYKGSSWVCTPGLAQIALCELKLKRGRSVKNVLEWFRQVQTRNGGFWGSYGLGAAYFSQVEISWAVKYYLDAQRLYIENWFDENTDDFPADILNTDMRYRVLADEVMALEKGSRIAEIGCGKGRFIKALLEDGYQGDIDGYDISRNLLRFVPNKAHAVYGYMEDIPCETDRYDLVYCIEALEHSQNVPRAVSEMIRILKPGGKLLVIDKDKEYWGLMKCSEWENWIGKEELRGYMCKQLNNVTVESVSEEMEFMLLWKGEKGNDQ